MPRRKLLHIVPLAFVLALGSIPAMADESSGTQAEAEVEVTVGPGGASAVPTATVSAPGGGATTTSTADSAVTSGDGGPAPSDPPPPPPDTASSIEIDVEAEAETTAGDNGAGAAAGTAAAVAAPGPGAVGSATSTSASADSGDGTQQESDGELTGAPEGPASESPAAEVEVEAEAETAPSDGIDVDDTAAAAAAAGSAGGATGPAPTSSHDAATATSSTTGGTDATAGGGPGAPAITPPESGDGAPPGENQSKAEAETEVTVRSEATAASAAAAGGSAASQAPYGSDSSTSVATGTSVDGGPVTVSNEDRDAGATTPASEVGHELEAEAEAIQTGESSAAAAAASGAGAGADVDTSTTSTEHGAAAAAAAAPDVDVSTAVTADSALASALAENTDCDGAAAAIAVVLAGEVHELEAESATACSIELVLELSLEPDGSVLVEPTENIVDPGPTDAVPPVDGEEAAEAEAEAATVDGSAAAAASAAAAGLGSVTSSQISAFAPQPAVDLELEPARLAESRVGPQFETIDGSFEGFGRLAAESTTTIRIAGRGGVPADAKAAIMNLVAVLPSADGFLTMYPCTPDQPLAASLNYPTGGVVANSVVAPLDANGDVCVYTKSETDIVIDVNGFVPASSDVGTLTPARLAESRVGPQFETIDGSFEGFGRVAAESTTTIRIAGRDGVPVGAEAAFLNLVAVRPSADGFLTIFPCTPNRPLAASLNYPAGGVVANGVFAPLDANGDVCVYTKSETDIVIDVNGFVPASSDLGTLTPARLAESRVGPQFETIDGSFEGFGRVAAESTTMIRIAGRDGVPVGAAGAFLNVAAVRPGTTGFITIYPCTPERPLAASLNFHVPGSVVANGVFAMLDANGDVCVYSTSATDIVIDVNGFVPG